MARKAKTKSCRMISGELLKRIALKLELISPGVMLYSATAKVVWMPIISSPMKKTCKEPWIDIQDGLMEKWKKLFAKVVTGLYKTMILLEINVFYTNIQ